MNRTFTFIAALALATTFASSAFALGACQNYVTVTPDTAAVDRIGINKANAYPGNGTPYTVATFCPKAAAAGTCTGEGLVLSQGDGSFRYVTHDGIVADITQHKNGILIPLPGPDLFVPLTPLLPGAC